MLTNISVPTVVQQLNGLDSFVIEGKKAGRRREERFQISSSCATVKP